MPRDATAEAGSQADDRFELDDSMSTLLWNLLLAVAAMFVAYAAMRVVAALAGLERGVGGFVFSGLVLAAFGTISIYVTSARPIRSALRRQRDAVLESERRIRAEAAEHRFASQVQDAMEMGESEADALEVASRALAEISGSPAEVLLADSSRAHLRQAAVSRSAGGAGCTVATPWGCPAVRRGQTLQFASSESLSACPRLTERGTACSAVCVPVTVQGTPMGVIHVTGEVDGEIEDTVVVRLEALALQAGSRIGMLRAMASTQLQASTDPLTGAVNRRSLEASVRELRQAGELYAVVFADLDHFKDLNDTHGHETGDRALRLFVDVVRSTVRPEDTICRYGGEEFVVLLRGITRAQAADRIEVVRRRLHEAVETGNLPRFSASFGIADSTQGPTAESIISMADLAMFDAKSTGRDRAVVAASPEPTSDSLTGPVPT